MTPLESAKQRIKRIEAQLKETKELVENIDSFNRANNSKESLLLTSEKFRIKEALKQFDGNRLNAAMLLKISERTIYRLIKKYKL